MSSPTRLYIASEIAEEYSSIMRRWIYRLIIGIMVTYVLFLIDGLPFLQVAVGLATHACYLSLFKTFPIIEPLSVSSISSLLMTLVSHFSWFNYFVNQSYHHVSPRFGFMNLVGFFLVWVWMVPLMLFVSLSTADEFLPSANASIGMTGNPAHNGAFAGGGGRKNRGTFKTFMDGILEKKNQLLPGSGKHY